MDNAKIYALLDADFIIKTIIAQKDEAHRLLDWVVSNPKFQFVCHEMAMEEVSRHDAWGVVPWIEKAVVEGKVRQYTDRDIVNGLCAFCGEAGMQLYKDFLRISCDAMNATYYGQNYGSLEKLDTTVNREAFLIELYRCDLAVGSAKSLGERKAMVLLQWLQFFHANKIYVFCSDDRGARAGVYSVTKVPCKSVMTIFWDMKHLGVAKDEAYSYFYPLECYLTQGGKTLGNIRVLNARGDCQISVPCKQIFMEIFEGKLDSMKTGFLKYRCFT